jgi:hypothetical protein
MSIQSNSTNPDPSNDMDSIPIGPIDGLSQHIPSSEGINDEQSNQIDATEVHDSLRYRQLHIKSDNPEHVPLYGTSNIKGQPLQIFARILITQPGDPITKTLTNPHVATSFRLQLPN